MKILKVEATVNTYVVVASDEEENHAAESAVYNEVTDGGGFAEIHFSVIDAEHTPPPDWYGGIPWGEDAKDRRLSELIKTNQEIKND